MGNSIDKYGLDRLQRKGLELSFKCPNCSSARLWMKQREDLDYWHGITCPKCGAKIILDSLTLVVMREGTGPQAEDAGVGPKVHA